MRNVLVTGGDAQLGTELQRARWPDDVCIVVVGRPDLNLTDTVANLAKVAEHERTAVIHGAAYTAVDGAESANVGIPLVQVSTDYVFSGDKQGAWEVDDTVAPLDASKLGGELAVRASGACHAIVRTAWIVSADGGNLLKTMLRMGVANPTLHVVADQHGSPNSAADLADALCTIVLRLIKDSDAPTGTFHFSNAGETTWADFARATFCQLSFRGGYNCGGEDDHHRGLSHACTAPRQLAAEPWRNQRGIRHRAAGKRRSAILSTN